LNLLHDKQRQWMPETKIRGEVQKIYLMGTSKNWILINFIEKPFFNQIMSGFAMKL